jgi:hypothetical protein
MDKLSDVWSIATADAQNIQDATAVGIRTPELLFLDYCTTPPSHFESNSTAFLGPMFKIFSPKKIVLIFLAPI